MFPLPLSFKYGKASTYTNQKMVCNSLIIDKTDNKMSPFLEIFLDYVNKKTNGKVCVNHDAQKPNTLNTQKSNTQKPNVFFKCDKLETTITYPMDESYMLHIHDSVDSSEPKITVLSPNQYGAMHALKTLLLLLEFDESNCAWVLPLCLITDKPEHPWRGLLVDPARHFISMDHMKKIIRVMSLLKYNVLHLHLSDDQGFCVESKFASAQFYTKDDLKEICLYANNLGIRVVPEIDIPGHVSQMIYKCPNLGTKTIPTEPEVRNCLLKPVLNVLSDFVIRELAVFFKEMMEIFQDKYFHLGGDEVDYTDWMNDKKIMDYMKLMNYGNDFKLLQIDFTRKIYNMVFKPYGKIIVCWDELYHKDLFTRFFSVDELVIQRWRNNAILSKNHLESSPGNIINSWGHYLNRLYPAAYYYKTTPSVTSTNHNQVIGGEGCLWGNLLSDTNIMSTLIPNLCPVAEQLWSCIEASDEHILNMYERLDIFDDLLTILEPTIDHQNISLKLPDMCNVLESIWGGFTKDHPRNSLDRKCNVPMRKLEDCVLPESRMARRLYNNTRKMIDAYRQDESNPFAELLYNEYKDVRNAVQNYANQIEGFNMKMNEIYEDTNIKRDKKTLRPRNQRISKTFSVTEMKTLMKKRSSSIDSNNSVITLKNSEDNNVTNNDNEFQKELKEKLDSHKNSSESSSDSSEDSDKNNQISDDTLRPKKPYRHSIPSRIKPKFTSRTDENGTFRYIHADRPISSVSSASEHLDTKKKNWTQVQKIIDRLCEYAMLCIYNSSKSDDYEKMLAFIESIESKYHDNMYIALCPAVKILITYRLNKNVYVPVIMQKLNKTKINGTFL